MRPNYCCWRCDRGLNIDTPPKNEPVIVLCPRCKAKNQVQALDNSPRVAAQLR